MKDLEKELETKLLDTILQFTADNPEVSEVDVLTGTLRSLIFIVTFVAKEDPDRLDDIVKNMHDLVLETSRKILKKNVGMQIPKVIN